MAGTNRTIAKFRDAFKALDADNDNFLAQDDLGRMLLALGLAHDAYDVGEWILEFGHTSEGRLNFKEFLALASTKLDALHPEAPTVQQIFQVFDKNNSGSMERDELSNVFKDLGVEASQEEIDALFEEFDAEESGTISLEEFAEIFRLTRMADIEGDQGRETF
mmetsp:Transcript_9279/g.18912  ORF Transcript_9279/g.18912 Transcript_9279/m.18912 type:complete len:163 (-) Transcript_9279:2736-3224(-)